MRRTSQRRSAIHLRTCDECGFVGTRGVRIYGITTRCKHRGACAKRRQKVEAARG